MRCLRETDIPIWNTYNVNLYNQEWRQYQDHVLTDNKCSLHHRLCSAEIFILLPRRSHPQQRYCVDDHCCLLSGLDRQSLQLLKRAQASTFATLRLAWWKFWILPSVAKPNGKKRNERELYPNALPSDLRVIATTAAESIRRCCEI